MCKHLLCQKGNEQTLWDSSYFIGSTLHRKCNEHWYELILSYSVTLSRMNGPNKKALLQNREKVLRDNNVPIIFNSWASIGGRNLKIIPKHMLIMINLYTDNLWPDAHKNHTETSFFTKIIEKLERIEDSPKVVIEVWQQI